MKDPLIRAHYKGCWYYFGPFESREEAQQLEARIKSAWINPHIQHLPINDPKDCLGVAMPGTSVTHNMPPCECHKESQRIKTE